MEVSKKYKKSKKGDTKVSKTIRKILKFPQIQVSKTTNFTPSDELTYLNQFSKKELVVSNDVMDFKKKGRQENPTKSK